MTQDLRRNSCWVCVIVSVWMFSVGSRIEDGDLGGVSRVEAQRLPQPRRLCVRRAIEFGHGRLVLFFAYTTHVDPPGAEGLEPVKGMMPSARGVGRATRARSDQVKRGRATGRRSTASWWRGTMISPSFAAASRAVDANDLHDGPDQTVEERQCHGGDIGRAAGAGASPRAFSLVNPGLRGCWTLQGGPVRVTTRPGPLGTR